MKVAYTSCFINRNRIVDSLFSKPDKDHRIERMEKLCFCICRAAIDHSQGQNFVWFEIYFDQKLGNPSGCFKMLESLYSQMNKVKCTIYPSHQTTIFRDVNGKLYGCGGYAKNAERVVSPPLGCEKELLPHGSEERLEELKRLLNKRLKEDELYRKSLEKVIRDASIGNTTTLDNSLFQSYKMNDFKKDFTFNKFKDELSQPLEFNTSLVEIIRGEVYKIFNIFLNRLIKYSQPKLCNKSKSYIRSATMVNTMFYFDEIKIIASQWEFNFSFTKFYNPYVVVNSGNISSNTPSKLLSMLNTKNYENFEFSPNDHCMFENHIANRRKKYSSESDDEMFFDAVDNLDQGDFEDGNTKYLKIIESSLSPNSAVNRPSIIFEIASIIGKECLLEIHTEAINSARKSFNALQEELYTVFKENLIDVIAANILILGRYVVTTYNYFMYTLSLDVGIDFDTILLHNLAAVSISIYEYDKSLAELSDTLCSELSSSALVSKAKFHFWTVYMKDIGYEKLEDAMDEFLTLISSTIMVDLKTHEIEGILF